MRLVLLFFTLTSVTIFGAGCTKKAPEKAIADEWCVLNVKIIEASDQVSRDEALDELRNLEKETEAKYPDNTENEAFWKSMEEQIEACIEEHGYYKDRLLEDMH